jgi:predicted enzyme related to lactoylglutathione lyase
MLLHLDFKDSIYKMGDGFIATLADPDGNYFQLIDPMEM